MSKVLVAGHICLDMTPVFYNSSSNDFEPGKLTVVGPAETHSGGAVSNTGLAMAFFGTDVILQSKIGNDAFGEVLSSIVSKNNVRSNLVIDNDNPTSYSIVIARPNIDRSFLHCPGCNNTFTSDDITNDDLKDVSLMHFGYPTLMRQMYLNNGDELFKLFKKVHDQNILTSLDLTVVDPLSEAGKVDWDNILKRTLLFVDFFVPSFEELLFMLNRPKYEELVSLPGDICLNAKLKDIKFLADKCISYGARVVLIKVGAAGMYYKVGKKEDFLSKINLKKEEWINKENFQKSYKPQKIVSATGAGDTSIAAFLSAIMKGYSIEKCVSYAAATGSLCCQTIDTLSGLKQFEEVDEMINNGWETQDFLKE